MPPDSAVRRSQNSLDLGVLLGEPVACFLYLRLNALECPPSVVVLQVFERSIFGFLRPNSRMILLMCRNRRPRSSWNPSFSPATENGWHGNPAVRMSTGSRLSPFTERSSTSCHDS